MIFDFPAVMVILLLGVVELTGNIGDGPVFNLKAKPGRRLIP